MRNIPAVKATFSICIFLSLVIGAFLLLNIKVIPEYTRLIDSGKKMLESVSELKIEETNYLLYHKDNTLDIVKDKIGRLKKLLSAHEKLTFAEQQGGVSQLAVWEEAMNLYERLFDQFVLYHKAVEKNITEIRNLEKNILAVIYSKMNPERGIIALQEIRINEKGYLIYRYHPNPPDEQSFEDKRKEAVSNLLIWAQKDKRIEEMMDKDNRLFAEIKSNYESQDDTLDALKKESGKLKSMADNVLEEGGKKLYVIYLRCAFLSIMLLVSWLITAVPIVMTHFADRHSSKGKE